MLNTGKKLLNKSTNLSVSGNAKKAIIAIREV
jgi:hypothetical protein